MKRNGSFLHISIIQFNICMVTWRQTLTMLGNLDKIPEFFYYLSEVCWSRNVTGVTETVLMHLHTNPDGTSFVEWPFQNRGLPLGSSTRLPRTYHQIDQCWLRVDKSTGKRFALLTLNFRSLTGRSNSIWEAKSIIRFMRALSWRSIAFKRAGQDQSFSKEDKEKNGPKIILVMK